MKAQIIVTDFPWGFRDKLLHSNVKRGAAANYPTMTIEELKSLPINKIADDINGCLLCMWCPSSLLKEGIDIMSHYNFTLKQSFIWIKTKKQPLDFFKKTIINVIKKPEITYNKKTYVDVVKYIAKSTENAGQHLINTLGFGMGSAFRNCHEICLIGTNNNKIYKQLQNRSQRTMCFAPNLKHSQKPEALQDALDIMFPTVLEKIELFARRKRPGWICLGNQIDGLDIRSSLHNLI